MSWKKTTIEEICQYTTSGGTPKSNIKEFYFPPSIPWLKTKEVNYCRIYETENCISEEGLKRSNAKMIPENSVIVAMYGQGDTAGRVAINKIPLATNQACCNLIIDEEKADYGFVYYVLVNMYNQLVGLKNGGAQPNLNANMIKKLEIPFPDRHTQTQIANMLSAYDDLIENNQKQIKLLEEAAQRLYKEWFIDLRFPGYEDTEFVDGIPKGWKILSICEVIKSEIGGGWGDEELTQKCTKPAYVIRGTDMHGITHGNFHDIPFRFHAESNLKHRKLQHGDIIFEVSGGSKTEGVAKTCLITQKLLAQFNSPVICASFCKMIRPSENISQYLYDAFQYMRKSGKTAEYDKKSASSIVNYRWNDFLIQEKLLLPELPIIKEYNKLAEVIYFNIQTKSILIEKLKQARDRLLPKLMNGEIEV